MLWSLYFILRILGIGEFFFRYWKIKGFEIRDLDD